GGVIVTAIDAIHGAAVRQIVFGGGDDMTGANASGFAQIALIAQDRLTAQLRNQFRVFRKAFVRASPAVVTHHRKRGRKGPVHAAGADLDGSDLANSLHQIAIAGGTQADVVREDSGAD